MLGDGFRAGVVASLDQLLAKLHDPVLDLAVDDTA